MLGGLECCEGPSVAEVDTRCIRQMLTVSESLSDLLQMKLHLRFAHVRPELAPAQRLRDSQDRESCRDQEFGEVVTAVRGFTSI